MSPKRCDRADDVARIEWMDAAEARAFLVHVAECPDCTRAREVLERSTSMLRGGSRELSPEGRVALREAIDLRVEREFRPRSVWLPISITASAAVLAIALWVRWPSSSPSVSLSPSPSPEPIAVVAPAPVKEVAIAREPAILRAGSRVPISGGMLAIERDSTIALGATGVKLIEGAIRVDIAGTSAFVIETPKAEVQASTGSLLVIAKRDELRVDVLEGLAKVREPRDEPRDLRAGDSIRIPPPVAQAPKKRERRKVEVAVIAPAPVERPIEVEPTPEIPLPHEHEHEHEREPELEPAPKIQPQESSAAELMAQADEARHTNRFPRAAALYRKVSEMPGPLAEEANYLAAETLSRTGENATALETLRAFDTKKTNSTLNPERTALRARILLSMNRIKDAAIAIENTPTNSVELQSARLLIAKAALENHPKLARELIDPLLTAQTPHTIRLRATRLAILAARGEGNTQTEAQLREDLARLEQKIP